MSYRPMDLKVMQIECYLKWIEHTLKERELTETQFRHLEKTLNEAVKYISTYIDGD